MKIHYMYRGHNLNLEELKALSARLETFGYYSVLLTFHSYQPDYLIKSAAALIPGNKLKYMIALRPYHISPQFCAMVTEGFNQIDSGRLIFNWIAGDFDQRNDEPLQLDVFGDSESINTMVKRTTFLRKFVEQFNSFDIVSVKPEMVFSGFSKYTLETTKMFDGTSLCMIDDYRKNRLSFINVKNKMVCVTVVILDSNEDVEEYKSRVSTINNRFVSASIIGDRETVKKQLLELKNERITDLLVDTNRPEDHDGPLSVSNDILVNNLIKEILEV